MTLRIANWNHGTLYEHAVWNEEYWDGGQWVGLVAHCCIAHDKMEPVDWMDCPVAGRWTLMRATEHESPGAPDEAENNADSQDVWK